MPLQLFLLLIVVITALAFDFTNGFHDAGNAMASSIATGALKPKAAVALSASLNLVGAFLSIAVAATIAKGLVDAHLVTLELVFAGLVGGIVWNLLTWLLGIPSSSSHALIGGIVGAMIAAVGGHGVIWHGLVSKVIATGVAGADDRPDSRHSGRLAGLPRHPPRARKAQAAELPLRSARLGVADLAGARHQRRAEDDGRHLLGADLLRRGQQQGHHAAAVGDRVVRGGDRGGHLPRRLAGDPHDEQGPGRDRVTAGHGGGYVVGDDHLAVQPFRLRAVHHPRRDRLDPGQRDRQARR